MTRPLITLPVRTAKTARALASCAALAAVAAMAIGAPVSAQTGFFGQSSAVSTPEPNRAAPVIVTPRGATVIPTNGPIIILPGHGHPPVEEPSSPFFSSQPVITDLPLSCIQTVSAHAGDVRVVEGRCLDAYGIDLSTLPRSCGQLYGTKDGVVRGYDPICLGDAGYRLAGR